MIRPKPLAEHYQVEALLHTGAAAEIYRVVDTRSQRTLAMKVLKAEHAGDEETVERFIRGAQMGAILDHPNIVIAYEIAEFEGRPALVMEYLEGESLVPVVDGKRELTLHQKVGIAVQVCEGLAAVHKAGIIHGNVSPTNVVLTKRGTAKIVDFYVCGGVGRKRHPRLVVLHWYLTPEQINAQGIDQRVDLWGTACLLYHMISGEHPFLGKDMATTLLQCIHEPLPALAGRVAGVPGELDSVLARATAKDREQRYASALELGNELRRVQGEAANAGL